jgi:DNA repair protein RecO
MVTETDTAIVLKSVVFEERHRIVTGITAEHGRVSAVARNSVSSRRYGGALEPFTASEWVWVDKEGSELGRLDRAEIKRSYDGIRRSFEKLALASSLNEILLRVAPEREPCPELFRLHSNALALIEEAAEPPPGTPADLKLINYYFAKVLQWSGNQPQIMRCMNCERSLDDVPNEIAMTWTIPEASWVCHFCRKGDSTHVQGREGVSFQHSLLRVMQRAARDLRNALTLPLRKTLELSQGSLEEHRELFSLMEALMIYHIPGFDQAPLKSLRFLKEPTGNLIKPSQSFGR